MVKEIFKIDKKFWSQSQCDEIDNFFQFNSFFSKFYEQKDYDKVLGMTFYTRLHKSSSLLLELNKKPEAIILLSGKIDIYKKRIRKIKAKKNCSIQIKENQFQEVYQFFATLTQQHQSIVIEQDCKVVSATDGEVEILFVSLIMYNQHMKLLESQNVELLFKGLRTYFPNVEKKALMNLAKSGCHFKDFKINDIIYRAGSNPQEVYLLMQGKIKMEKTGITSKRMQEIVIIEAQSMFGQKDIKLPVRQQSAVTCSAYARMLVIPKSQFLRFAKEYLQGIVYQSEEQKDYTLPILRNNRNSLYVFEDKKDKIKRFHSSRKIENEKSIETKIIKNSHILVNLSPNKSKTERFEGNKEDLKDYSRDQFQEKMRLFHRIRPNAKIVDFQNPIINLTPKRNMTIRNSFDSFQD